MAKQTSNNSQSTDTGNADDLLAVIQDKHDAIVELLADAEATVRAITAAQEAATTSRAELTATASEIAELLEKAKQDRTQTEALAENASSLDTHIDTARSSMANIVTETQALQSQVESLLPGATSTGLAVAFMERKSGYRFSRRLWTGLTIASIAVLACLGWNSGLSELASKPDATWGPLLRGLVWRLPVVLPTVWLAIYGARHQLLNTRLEEDYAYKEALSRSFEGYKRQMQEFNAESDDAPLSVLCSNTLNALSQSPGRLYDKKHADFTPVNALLDSMDKDKLDSVLKLLKLPDQKLTDLLKAVK